MTKELQKKAAEYRLLLLARERAAATELVQHYGRIYQRIQMQIADLLARVDESKKRGEFSPGWIHQQQRLETLRRQCLAELHAFAVFADLSITDQQRQAVYQAQQHAQDLTQAAMGQGPAGVAVTFARLPSDAVRDLIGTLQDGSPLKALIDTIGPQVADAVKSALVSGLATGENPRSIARRVRQATGVGLTRALTISRTETLRSYRTAAIRSYQENDDVVNEWEWTASHSARTCAVCLAMDGKRFPLDTPFASHPNCRCVPTPVTKSWAELGYGVSKEEQMPPRQDGASWFADQPEEVQRQVLGNIGLELYRKGVVTLADFVGIKNSVKWGKAVYTRSVSEVRTALDNVHS